MKQSLVLLALVFSLCGVRSHAEQPTTVRTQCGLIQGAKEADLTVYRGIPFATPPVGQLRWQPPQPLTPWEGARDATKFGPDPFQGNGQGNVSEDCLYLNVWTPAKSPTDKLPVLVWIYGGGFSFGSTSTPTHNGEHLARKGVVLVSINYRVGTLGFLAHPELTAESPNKVSGNYGIQDQIAGLRWVKNNIAAFGGDPERVTIFGESAGGISVSMLCASPMAKGLFRAAISQSGGSFGPTRPTSYPGENMRVLPVAERDGVAYMNKAGAANLAELRKLPPEKLPPSWGSGSAWPVVDGCVIPDDEYKLYQQGRYNEVAILVGYNSDEGLFFTPAKTLDEYVSQTNERYGPFAEKLRTAFPASGNKIGHAARNLTRDVAFGWHTWSWARFEARAGKSNVYLYHFDQHAEHPKDSPEADSGSAHGIDVPYVFQTLDRADPKVTADDLKVSDLMASYWTNFAKNEDPNGPGLPVWPKFDEKDQKVLWFHKGAQLGTVAGKDGLEAVDAYYAWRRSPEGAAWAK